MTKSLPKLLVVDDDERLLASLLRALRADYQVLTAGDPQSAKAAFLQLPDIILLDIVLHDDRPSDRSGVELLKGFRQARPDIPVVMFSGHGDVDIAVECMQAGAVDFIEKPADIRALKQRLARALKNANISRKAKRLEARLQQLDPAELVGEAPAMIEVKRLIDMVAADGHVTVLITGETGTGKELVAKSIHRKGWRSDAPCITISVSSLSQGIVESELFGHEAGAFTGAGGRRAGYLEEARGGVLFLDEVGDLPEEAQLKLLRFLETRSFARAGSTESLPIDVQIVAATNRDLSEALTQGSVRKDFYYRLKSIEISLPPLRERREDISLLTEHFLTLLVRQGRLASTEMDRETLTLLTSYEWPGNVRELRAALESAAIRASFGRSNSIRGADLPAELHHGQPRRPSGINSELLPGRELDVGHELATRELAYIEQALVTTNGRKADAAIRLGFKDRFTLRRRVLSLFKRYPSLGADFPTIAGLFRRG